MSNKLEDLGKSMELAGQIEGIKAFAMMMDLDHLRESIKHFREQASFQDSAAVLNPRYNPKKSQLLDMQATALENLLGFVERLKKCQEMKDSIKQDDAVRDEIEKMFF